MGFGEPLRVRQGPARWEQPSDLIWTYEQFAAAQPADSSSDPPIVVPLVIESKFRGHGAMESWTINGHSYPDTGIAPLMLGRRSGVPCMALMSIRDGALLRASKSATTSLES
jgi:hypothetical protein